MASQHVILSGDIGGTNSRFEVFSVSPIHNQIKGKPTPGKLIFSKKYQNEKFGSFLEVIETFLSEAQCALPSVACLAVAGPVSNNRAVFTNRGWEVDGEHLREETGISRVVLINDFAGVAYGLLTLSDSDCITLQEGTSPVEGGPIACVGAGTGLGMCYLCNFDGNYKAFTSEGGHAEFAPRTDLETELWRFLKNKFGERYRVSHERVISGLGLFNIYDFLRQFSGKKIESSANIDSELERTSTLGSLKVPSSTR
jgi:glucokinase